MTMIKLSQYEIEILKQINVDGFISRDNIPTNSNDAILQLSDLGLILVERREITLTNAGKVVVLLIAGNEVQERILDDYEKDAKETEKKYRDTLKLKIEYGREITRLKENV
jgi:hypothetical protein